MNQTPEPVARLLYWNAPSHFSVPHDGVCARTFTEFPEGAGEGGTGYWKEGAPLYLAPEVSPKGADTLRAMQLAEADGKLLRWIAHQNKELSKTDAMLLIDIAQRIDLMGAALRGEE